MKSILLALFISLIALTAHGDPVHDEAVIFIYDVPTHVHASSIVETSTGELIAVWYENGPKIDDPRYYYERRDKSSDVRIGGARKPLGGKWSKPFVMADTFGVSDNNPTMIIDHEQRLWLIYPTLLGVPEWSWGSALVRYRIAKDLGTEGPPLWTKSDILVPHPTGLEAVIDSTRTRLEAQLAEITDAEQKERMERYIARLKEGFENPLIPRLGWMPRAHPLIRKDGTLILPLSNENFNIAVMAMTNDGGESWTYSEPVPEMGLTQPTLVEFEDGQISAFFRNSGPEHRIKRSDSADGGKSWGPVTVTDLVHPGAGIEALLLKNGNLLMIYNDVEKSPRDRLAVSISEDRGKTWKWTRHLEDVEGARFDYPSVIQTADGMLHATFSYNLETIMHTWFNEEWIQMGD